MKSIGFHALSVLLGTSILAQAQPENMKDTASGQESLGRGRGYIEVQAVQTGETVPFWMRSMQHGNIPLSGTSMAAIAGYAKEYGSSPGKTDWGYGLQLRGDLGKEVRGTVLEAYAKARLKSFEFKIGRFRQALGLSDSSLGMGNFSYSGNALPIPMVQIGLRDYSFPLFDSLVSFHGTFGQGWMGDTKTKFQNNLQNLDQYMHLKSLYMRVGRPDAKVKGVFGLVHQVFWVNNRKLYGDTAWDLSPLQTYFYIVTAKRYLYKPGISETTTVGNNLGHFDLGLEITAPNSDVRLYRQIFYESVRTLSDGITGISVTHRGPAIGRFQLRKFVFEYMSSMNQGYDGSVSPPRYDNYYNHEFLYEGVSYKGKGVGTPFIPLRSTIRSGFPATSAMIIAFNDTRVRAVNAGVEWGLGKVLLRNRFSYSMNYGMYETQNTFPPSGQFSMSMEAATPLRKGWQARAVFALDAGELLYNTAGGFLSLARSF